MKCRMFALLGALLCATALAAQTRIAISAGTPEDKDLQTISAESDAQKRATLLGEFVVKYAGNASAVALGNAQLSQIAAASGDSARALALGDKALAAMPDLIEVLQSQADIAQQAKLYDKVVDYAARGAAAIRALQQQPKPARQSSEDWAAELVQQKQSLQPTYAYFEAAAYNSTAAENDPATRLAMVQRFLQAFPGSQFSHQASALAILSLQESKDTARLVSFGDQAVAANPNDAALRIVLANALSESPGYEAKASGYARQAIELAKNASDAETRKAAGVGHSIVGYVLLKQNKAALAVPELKTATSLLQDDPDALAAAWFRLGFAYAKLEQATNALAALNKAAAIPGPYQQPAQDIIAKIKAARKK